jgi:ribosome maturation protein Sdo1
MENLIFGDIGTDSRKEHMLVLRKRIDPLTNKFHTLESIGKQFGISRQRVQVIIGKTGEPNTRDLIKFICPICKKEFQSRKTKRIFCSLACCSVSKKTKGRHG